MIIQLIDKLNTLECVELAWPVAKPVPPPVPPNFQSNQVYLNAAPSGVDALNTWTSLATTGTGVRVVDLEYSWNLAHLDLPSVTVLGPASSDPFNDNNHGTAVLGELAALNNGWGTTGIAHGSQIHVSPTVTQIGGFSIPSAIFTAMAALSPGDVILIEQQAAGPNGGSAYVPVEWDQSTYSAIVTAVGNGIIVVEAAGNGNQDLDSAIFSTGHGGHWPFLPQNDSGAIIVGAGAASAPLGSTNDRSRLSFSTYGSTVDLQGWGERVWTCGYGNGYSSEGNSLWYSSTFSGTSSASPIVAASCALLQSRYKAAFGVPLSPGMVRTILRNTGSPQQSGAFPATQNIGPRPNVFAAINSIVAPPPSNNDCSSAALAHSGSNAFTTVSATTDGPDEPAGCGFGGVTQIANDVWFKWLATCTGTATVSLCGSNFDARLAVYFGCPGASGLSLGCKDNFCGTSPQLSFSCVQSTLYRIRIGGANSATGTGSMVISCIAAPAPCPADFNHSGAVDIDDLVSVITAWGPCPVCAADVNASGAVDIDDLVTVITAWGVCP